MIWELRGSGEFASAGEWSFLLNRRGFQGPFVLRRRHRDDRRWEIVGEGPDKHEMKQLAESLAKQPR